MRNATLCNLQKDIVEEIRVVAGLEIESGRGKGQLRDAP